MRRLVDFFLSNRWVVFALLVILIAGGLEIMFHLPLEAFPDLTNNQVVVTVQCPGMSPVEVEQLVTFPLESAMLGMPKLQTVRSTSKLDLSMVTVIFDDSVDRYLVRQLVAERLNQVQSRIPSGLQPQMNPMATAFRRGVSVHRSGSQDVADGAEDTARLGHTLYAADHSRRQRDQLLGRRDQAVHR